MTLPLKDTAAPVDKPVSVALALEQSQNVKAKVEECADDLGSANEILKQKIAEGATTLSAPQALMNTERVETKVQECADDLHQVTESIAGLEHLEQTEVALTQALEMNEALMLGSVRQHELTEAADLANAQLQKEINEHKETEKLLHRAQAQLTDRAGQLEDLVARRTSELTATNKQLEAFVHSIAHDLRAPLRAMQGFSTILVEEAGAALSETVKGYADRINESAQYMDAMLSDLLAFSRISQQSVALTSVKLEMVVESVLSLLQKDIQEKNARVESSGPWPVVLAHEPTLNQVLFNLTSNALKFVTPDVPPLVRLRAEEQAQFIRVWVEDNGVGIAPDYQDQIFRLFNRLDGDKYAGTGIGLAIVQKGVERMGGRVGVESAAGQGSRFWFELKKA